MNKRDFAHIHFKIQMPCRCVTANISISRAGASLKSIIVTGTRVSIRVLPAYVLIFGVYNSANVIPCIGTFDDIPYGRIISIIIPCSSFFHSGRRQRNVVDITQCKPTVVILFYAGRPISNKLRIYINPIVSFAFRNLLLIPAAGNPIRQRPHRQQIDEHQRRHQNGYKAFYFIPHCLILLFHLEAALPLLPERSKRICGQTVRRLKKRFGKNGRFIPARRFPPPRRALRVQPPPRARQPPRVRRPQASARSGQRGDSSN